MVTEAEIEAAATALYSRRFDRMQSVGGVLVDHHAARNACVEDAKVVLTAAAAVRPAQAYTEGWYSGLAKMKERLDVRLNNCLCEMKPDYDDSIVGFNEAWDIVRKSFSEAIDASDEAYQHQ